MRKPTLKATNQKLLEVFASYPYLDRKDIEDIFGVKRSTASNVLDYCIEYGIRNNIKWYKDPDATMKYVDTDLLFNAYGWDINIIKSRLALLA